MLKTYRIGRLAGFPLEVNLTFLIMLGVVLIWMGGLAGLMIVGVAFGSVLLHELGHAVVARHLGVPVVGIELHFFGGTAKMMGQPKSAGDEIAIAAAGPVVSFALGGLGLLLGAATGAWVLTMAGWMNLVIAGFNLIPALPLDGGRIFRAALVRRHGFGKATHIAATIGKGFAIALGVFAVVASQIYLALLAVVVWFMAGAEQRNARFGGYGAGGFTGPAAGPRRPLEPEVEVLPRGYRPDRPVSVGRYVVRSRNGRMVIEYVE